jgi:hypothetical protein
MNAHFQSFLLICAHYKLISINFDIFDFVVFDSNFVIFKFVVFNFEFKPSFNFVVIQISMSFDHR